MRASVVILVRFMGIFLWSAAAWSAEAAAVTEGASYADLKPGVFMRQWLVCGPFPVSEEEGGRPDTAAQRKAFYHDYLEEHGGEAEIRPTTEMVHKIGDGAHQWQHVSSETDVVNLNGVFGYQEYAIAYAWAEIEMPEAQAGLLGIGSDDAVRIWLNGEPVTENWADRPAQPDDDLVLVNFREGRNQLLMKVQNHREGWGFACRLLDGETLGEKLFAAMSSGDFAVAQMCLVYGADVNAKDKHGFTPLQVARMRGHKELVELLLAKGADPDAEMPPAGEPLGFLDILWGSLQENYPMLEYAGAFDDRWYEACKREIEDANNLYEALPIMDRMLVMRLHDYHTGMYWDGKAHLAGLPMRLDLIEEQIVVTECPEGLGVTCGDIVREIDGVDAKQRFDEAMPDAFGATRYAKANTACRAIVEGQPDSEVKLTLRNREGEDYEVTLTRGGYSGGGGRPPVLSSRVIDDDTGYIKIRGWGGFAPEEFDEKLEPLREKSRLILDVRDNGGGSDSLAEKVIGRFITEGVLCSVGFQRQAGTKMYEKIVFVAQPRGPWRYEGKVAVLTNAGCASACEHFVSGMFEAGALLVGTPTTGACGWSKGIDLPGGVTLRCSLTFPLHGKVPSPLHGMEPHHLVTPTIEDIRAGRDTVLEKALDLLSE
jgi:C-terminal processing protease CtpA/Prc